jgi:hypothetical protein
MRYLALLFVVLFASCHQPIPQPAQPPIVRASDLVQSFAVSSEAANDAYTGQRITVLLTGAVARGNELHWHLGADTIAATVVCHFAAPPESGQLVWVSGICAGRVRDGVRRELPGYDFHIVITDCRLVPPPNTRAP